MSTLNHYPGLSAAAYRISKDEYLEQIAYMDTRNREFAEKNGGIGALSGSNLQRYQGIEQRLIRLAAFQDAAENYISDLLSEIDELLRERNYLRSELNRATGNQPAPPMIREQDFLRLMLFGAGMLPKPISAILDQKEARRAASKEKAINEQPELF